MLESYVELRGRYVPSPCDARSGSERSIGVACWGSASSTYLGWTSPGGLIL